MGWVEPARPDIPARCLFWVSLRTRPNLLLAHERLDCRDLFFISIEIARNTLIKMCSAEIELVRRRILADESGDLVHFRDPAVGLGRHEREVTLEPGEYLRLAAREFGKQGICCSAAGGSEQHGGAERLGSFGDPGIRHFQC